MMGKINWTNHALNFIAVILGVLLAFYINENALQQKNRKELSRIKESLVRDLKEDINTYENYQIPVNNQQAAQIDTLIQFVLEKSSSRIDNYLYAILQVENYTPNSSTYNSLKSSGQISLFDDLETTKTLDYYYDGLALECQEKNKAQVNYFMDEVIPWMTRHSDLAQMKLRGKPELTTLQNILIMYQLLIQQKADHYGMIVDEAKALTAKLASE
jgi:hypothetical protein